MITPPKIRTHCVNIVQAANGGFIVEVGCERFVFGNSKEAIDVMCSEIATYLKNPREVEREFNQKRHADSQVTCGTMAPPQPVEPLEGPVSENHLTPEAMARRLEEQSNLDQ